MPLRWAMLLLVLWAAPAPAGAQFSDEQIEQWLAAGKKHELPWRIQIYGPELSLHQRQQVSVEVVVPGRELAKVAPFQDLFLIVVVREQGQTARLATMTYSVPPLERLFERSGIRRYRELEIVFAFPIYLLPGRYAVDFILHERVTGQRSVTERRVKVKPLRDDPLPQIARDLPRAELAPQADADAIDFGSPRTRLWLPVKNTRRIEVELLGDFSDVQTTLPVIRTLSQIQPANGTVHLTLFRLDGADWQILLEKKDPVDMDWEGYLKSLQGNADTAGMDLASFLALKLSQLLKSVSSPDSAGLLRQLLTAKLDCKSVAPETTRVVILVRAPQVFASREEIKRTSCSGTSDVRFYHLLPMPANTRRELEMNSNNQWEFSLPAIYHYDESGKMLRQWKPRTMFIDTPKHLRKVLATLLSELERL